jgi:DNA-binding CsgD family transcriptional regulator
MPAKKCDRRDRVIGLVGEIYDAVFDASLWHAMAPKVAGAFDASSSGLAVRFGAQDPLRMSWATDNFTNRLARDYESHYHKQDVWAIRGANTEMSKVFVGHELIANNELANSEFYQDYCRELDVFHLVGSVIALGGGGAATFGIHRTKSAQPFDEDDKQLAGSLLPHLRRALQIQWRLGEVSLERSATGDVLERAGVAAFVVAGDGTIQFANCEAETLLRAGQGIRSIERKLATGCRPKTERLSALVQQAALRAAGQASAGGDAFSLEREGRLPLTVLVAPFHPQRNGYGAFQPAALVLIRDPERLTLSLGALQGLFGFTGSEAAVAGAMAEGKSIEEIAGLLGITLNTARTHLKSIRAKTGTTRQAELVALLWRSVASFDLKSLTM